MAENKKIIIAEIKSNDKFFNIKDNNGIEYGIGRDKSPILSKKLETAKAGDEITGEYFLWKDKHYLSDPKEGGKSGGKSFPAADKSFDAAKVAAAAAAGMLSLTKDATTTQFDTLFEHIHTKIMSKKSAAPAA